MSQANKERISCPFLDEGDDPVAEVSGSLARITKFFQHLKQHTSAGNQGLDATGYPVLFTLAHGAVRISTLAEAVYSDVSTISRQVAALEKHGYVERTPDPADGRASLVAITQAGADFIAGMMERRQAFLHHVLANWSDDDVATFARLLARFHDDAVERAPSGINPHAQGGQQ